MSNSNLHASEIPIKFTKSWLSKTYAINWFTLHLVCAMISKQWYLNRKLFFVSRDLSLEKIKSYSNFSLFLFLIASLLIAANAVLQVTRKLCQNYFSSRRSEYEKIETSILCPSNFYFVSAEEQNVLSLYTLTG